MEIIKDRSFKKYIRFPEMTTVSENRDELTISWHESKVPPITFIIIGSVLGILVWPFHFIFLLIVPALIIIFGIYVLLQKYSLKVTPDYIQFTKFPSSLFSTKTKLYKVNKIDQFYVGSTFRYDQIDKVHYYSNNLMILYKDGHSDRLIPMVTNNANLLLFIEKNMNIFLNIEDRYVEGEIEL